MNRMHRGVIAASSAGLLLIGLVGGYWWARRADGSVYATPSSTVVQPRNILYWYDPMVPEQHFPKAGKSPMGMDMVAKYADGGSETGIRIDPDVQQNVGIRTALVETGGLSSEIRVPATLTWDLRQESVVSARVDGIVSRLNIKAPYDRVRRGQPLATVLAPMWSSAIAESAALSHATSADARSLQAASRQRLHVLGLSGSSAGGNGGVVLRSPSDGVVSEVLVREGQTTMAGTPMFRINGTRTLWLEADIPQAGTAGIRPGTKVTATVSAVPGKTFDGEVETLLPQIEAATRTQRARIVLHNDEGLLVPGMFAELLLRPEGGDTVPLIPSEALIATGTDSRVIVVGADGRFNPVRVQTGRSSGGRVEILSGLKGGERVVTSGQFLIDSEASLSGALERLDTAPATAPKTSPTPSMKQPTTAPDADRSGRPAPAGKRTDAMQGTQMDATPKRDGSPRGNRP
jgi:Cu(I)/Ag(I) efflux system membrane fusion protein